MGSSLPLWYNMINALGKAHNLYSWYQQPLANHDGHYSRVDQLILLGYMPDNITLFPFKSCLIQNCSIVGAVFPDTDLVYILYVMISSFGTHSPGTVRLILVVVSPT